MIPAWLVSQFAVANFVLGQGWRVVGPFVPSSRTAEGGTLDHDELRKAFGWMGKWVPSITCLAVAILIAIQLRLPFSSSAIVMAPRHFVQCLSASQFIDMGWARRSSDEIDALIAELETDELTFEQFQVGPISEAAIRMCRECR